MSTFDGGAGRSVAGCPGFSSGFSSGFFSGFASGFFGCPVSSAALSASLRVSSGDFTSRRTGTATIRVGFA